MSVDELFPSSASGGGAGSSTRSSAAAVAPAGTVKGKDEDLSRIPTGASTSTSTDAGAQPYLRDGNASARSLATTDGRSSPLPRPASPASPPQRPFQPRQPSYEGAPFARSKHSFHSSDGVYPGSPLRRSTSLSAGANGTAHPRSPVHPSSPLFGRDAVGLASDGSPYSRGGSALASRDDLPLGSGAASISTSRHRGSHSTTEALRSGISRRLDRIRGRTMDEASATATALDSQAHDSPAQGRSDSDYAARSPSRRPQPPLPSPGSGGELGAASRRQFERPYLRKNNTSVDVTRPSGFESDGPMRSSGDEALMGGGAAGGKAWRRASNRILQSAWQGFKTSLDTYPDPWGYPPAVRPTTALGGSGGRGRLAASGPGGRDTDGALRRSHIAEAEEEEDSEGEWAATRRRRRQPREVVDLGEDDFGRLNRCALSLSLSLSPRSFSYLDSTREPTFRPAALSARSAPRSSASTTRCRSRSRPSAPASTSSPRTPSRLRPRPTSRRLTPRRASRRASWPTSRTSSGVATSRRRTTSAAGPATTRTRRTARRPPRRRAPPTRAALARQATASETAAHGRARRRLASRPSTLADLAATAITSRRTLVTSPSPCRPASRRALARRRSPSRPTPCRRTAPSCLGPRRSAERQASRRCSTPSRSVCSRTSCAT